MMLPTSASELSISLIKTLNEDTVFIRWYQKWAADYTFVTGTSNHNGARVSCNYPGPGITPNPDGSGFLCLSVAE